MYSVKDFKDVKVSSFRICVFIGKFISVFREIPWIWMFHWENFFQFAWLAKIYVHEIVELQGMFNWQFYEAFSLSSESLFSISG